MVNEPFDSIEKSSIDALVANKTAERRTLEYKAELPQQSDEAKREFLGDIASLANSGGGDILYGVTDERDENGQPTGRPDQALGLAGVNESAEQLRLESMIITGIAPRIAGVRVRTIPGFANGPVLLVRIPRSWAAPHIVTFKNLSRFYARNSAGKYQLDIGEIRSAFALSESVPEKIRAFRTDRLARIASGETPVQFAPNCAAVLHLLPLSAIEGRSGVDISREAQRNLAKLTPVSSSGLGHRFNADGFLVYDDTTWGQGRIASTYVQAFRSGAVEAADQRLLIRQNPEHPEHEQIISMVPFERRFIHAVKRFVGFQRDVGITPPVVLMLSLLGVENFALATSSSAWTASRIDRDTLIAPDLLIEDFTFEADRLLRPVFDFVWQSAGESESPNYDSDERWRPPEARD